MLCLLVGWGGLRCGMVLYFVDQVRRDSGRICVLIIPALKCFWVKVILIPLLLLPLCWELLLLWSNFGLSILD